MATDNPNEPDSNSVLSQLIARAEDKGDLPVFNASISRVRKISSDPNSHAMALAQTIMKDVNLSTKVLRIANSSFYNRGQGKIGSLSRGVVLLGFDTIKSLCMTLKMIESFQDNHPQIGMKQIVARAYLTAGFVREVAVCAGSSKDAEEIYLCGLFRELGEICVAYFMPNKFLEMIELQKSGVAWAQAQERALGMSLTRIGQQLASYWNFSSKTVSAMRDYDPATAGPVRNKDQLRHAIVSLCSQIVGGLYVDRGNRKDMKTLFNDLAEATGVKSDRLQQTLNECFQVACELAKDYGLNQTVLEPLATESGDPLRDKYAHEFSFLATRPTATTESPSATHASVISVGGGKPLPNPNSSVAAAIQPASNAVEHHRADSGTSSVESAANADLQNRAVSTSPVITPSPPVVITRGDPNIQLSIIQEITAMVTEQVSLNMLFVKILEGLHRGVGFDRAMLCLISPDRSQYAGRIALGKDSESLKGVVTGPVNEKQDLFSRILMEGSDLFIDDTGDRSFADQLPAGYRKQCAATQILISGIRTTTRRPLGFFYVDNATTGAIMSADLQRGFVQFMAQARLAVQIRG
jgi:HD-like signal output (HDOD) protein